MNRDRERTLQYCKRSIEKNGKEEFICKNRKMYVEG